MRITTVLDNDIRKRLRLSINQYAVMSLIHKDGHKSLFQIRKIFGFSQATASSIVKSLEKKGYLERQFFTDTEAMNFMSADFKKRGCIVCGTDELTQQHHYPVRKKDGGKKVVTMCAEHHQLFHRMTDYGILYSTLNVKFP